ncbi:hypothetical protein CHS0354_000698 [Potamilus streckersoni]|uniref:Helix-hairpin-helix DNA-binding motif class 1 domain-containing protein n=1 Tax=Potamilus streckersoni TaxID=2493646 RepID=A0AAE0T761_9BIVA|nr:hypothetical protein CHS0354_000698 [Potamilus streckersoni]
MPQNKSAEKRVRQSESRNERNREQKKEMKILIKGLKRLVDEKSGKEQIELALRKSVQKLDRLSIMIEFLVGKLVEKSPTSVVLDVGGVGFRMFVSAQTSLQLDALGQQVKMLTVMRMREDGVSLFGFLVDDERQIFRSLLSVTGIGPKLAMIILSGITPSEFSDLVTEGSIARLTAFPGIGKRTAERIVVELKDKLPLVSGLRGSQGQAAEGVATDESLSNAKQHARKDAFSALVALGYSNVSSEKAVRLAWQEQGDADAQLLEGGLKVGLYSSPHIIDFRERIRINGQVISEERVTKFIDDYVSLFNRFGASFFEMVTLLAFCYFAEENVDVAVIEVGLGGRLDATNVLHSKKAMITAIDFDHTEFLGDTLGKIAQEKCGIITPKSKVITTEQPLEVCDVMLKATHVKRAKLIFAPMITNYQELVFSFGKMKCTLETPDYTFIGIESPLWCEYQLQNIAMAVLQAQTFGCSTLSIKRGIKNVIQNTGFRGRMELLRNNFLIDVSHNFAGVTASVATLQKYRSQFNRVVGIFNAMADKDVELMLREVSSFCDELWLVPLNSERATSIDKLEELADSNMIKHYVFQNVEDAIKRTNLGLGANDLVWVTGSFVLVGEALQVLEGHNTLQPNEILNTDATNIESQNSQIQ